MKAKTALNKEKVETLLSKLLAQKSIFIIDQQNEKQQKLIERLLKRPYYEFELELDNKTVSVSVSEAIGSFPGLAMEKWKNVLIVTSTSKHPYIASRKIFNILNKKNKQLSSLSIQKLFY